eukprot:9380224-Prorocentrum_lima.AAC.1
MVMMAWWGDRTIAMIIIALPLLQLLWRCILRLCTTSGSRPLGGGPRPTCTNSRTEVRPCRQK